MGCVSHDGATSPQEGAGPIASEPPGDPSHGAKDDLGPLTMSHRPQATSPTSSSAAWSTPSPTRSAASSTPTASPGTCSAPGSARGAPTPARWVWWQRGGRGVLHPWVGGFTHSVPVEVPISDGRSALGGFRLLQGPPLSTLGTPGCYRDHLGAVGTLGAIGPTKHHTAPWVLEGTPGCY